MAAPPMSSKSTAGTWRPGALTRTRTSPASSRCRTSVPRPARSRSRRRSSRPTRPRRGHARSGTWRRHHRSPSRPLPSLPLPLRPRRRGPQRRARRTAHTEAQARVACGAEEAKRNAGTTAATRSHAGARWLSQQPRAQRSSSASANGGKAPARTRATGQTPSGAKPQRAGGDRPGGERHRDIGSVVSALFSVPPPPVIFAAASGVAGHTGGPPLTALMVLVMLGLSAVTVAGGRLAPVGLPVDRVRLLRRPQAPAAVEVATPVPQIILPEPTGVPPEAAAAWFAPIELAIVDQRATLATRSSASTSWTRRRLSG